MQRINAGVASMQGKIYVVGGWDGIAGLNTATRVAPAGKRGAGRWQPLPEMSIARECPGVAVLFRGAGRSLTGGLYAVGGAWGARYHSSCEVYNARSGAWEPKAAMGVKRCGVGVASLGGKLYAVGGFTQPVGEDYFVYHSSVECYDPVEDEWKFVTAMGTPRARAGVAVVDGRLYACGGYSGPNYHSSVEMFDPADGTWQPTAPMGTARSGPGVALAGGMLYAVGGSTPSGYLSSAERLDPRSPDGWSPIASMGAVRACLGIAEILGELYAIGGSDDAAHSSSGCSVSRYDARVDRWEAVVAVTRDRLFAMAEKELWNPCLAARAWRSFVCCCCTGTGGREETEEQLVELLGLPSLASPREKSGERDRPTSWTASLPAPETMRGNAATIAARAQSTPRATREPREASPADDVELEA